MWGWIWTLLAVAGLVFLAWRAWTLVRAGLGTLRSAGLAGERLGEASARAENLLAESRSRQGPGGPTMFDDPARLRARVRERRARRRALRDQRHRSREAVWQVWARATWLQRRHAAREPVDRP